MFAIVEHQEEVLQAQGIDKSVLEGLTRAGDHTERGRDRLRHGTGITDRRQLAEPRAIPILGQHPRRSLERDTRLANTTNTRQRHYPSRLERGGDLRQLVLTPNESCELQRQIRRKRIQRAQDRKLGQQPRMHNLKHSLRTRQIR
jgi:hypothetical protein